MAAAHRRRACRARSTSTSSTTRPIRWRTRPPPARRSCEQMDGDVDAVVVGVGSGGTLTGLGRFFAKASPKTADGAGRPGRLDPRAAGRRAARRIEPGSWVVEGIGEDFVPDNCDLVAGEARPTRSPTARASPRRAALLDQGRHPRRLVVRHAAGRRAALLPRADRRRSASSRSSATPAPLPLQGLQRQLGDRAGPGRARPARRPARPDRPRRRRRRGHRRAGRHAADRLQPHARRRRQPAAGAGRRPADRPDRRERPPGSGRGPPRRRRASPAGRRRHDRQAAHPAGRRSRSTRCCRSSSATRWRSCWTAASSSA